MADELTADEIQTLFGLESNATCGFVRVTFMSKQSIAAGGLPAPFAAGRPLGSALYFMVTPGAPVRVHRQTFTTKIGAQRAALVLAHTAPVGGASAKFFGLASAKTKQPKYASVFAPAP